MVQQWIFLGKNIVRGMNNFFKMLKKISVDPLVKFFEHFW